MSGAGPAGELTYADIRARLARLVQVLDAQPDRAAEAVEQAAAERDTGTAPGGR